MNDQPQVLALGEVLWDVFPDGPRFGGAPANFACHSVALGVSTDLASRVGDDPLGSRARQFLSEHGVRTECLQIDRRHPTGSVNVTLDEAGIPTFEIQDDVAWDYLELTPDLERRAADVDAIYFGTLSQRRAENSETIQRLVEAAHGARLQLLDLNLRAPFFDAAVITTSLEAANSLKLNEEELQTVAQLLGIGGDENAQLTALQARYSLRLIALTRGPNGSSLITETERSDRDGQNVAIVDTVGAGDSFTATLAVGYLQGQPLDKIHDRAIQVASFVCTQSGAVPQLPARLRRP